MAEVKTIKDVDDSAWASFKSLAARDRMKLGPFFKTLVQQYEKKSSIAWERILNSPKILSDEEAEEMRRTVKKLRSEYGFRK